MSVKLTPLHDRVLVRREKEAERTAGGIYIPDTAREKPQVGTIVAVGTGKWEKGQLIPLAVKEGDRVLFGKYAGTETPRRSFEVDDEELLILREEEILAIVGISSKAAPEKHEKAAARKSA